MRVRLERQEVVTPAEKIAPELRRLIEKQIQPLPEPVCCLLSAGIDSQSLLHACLELGKRVFTVNFTLDGRMSSDASNAKITARRFGIEHRQVFLPADKESLQRDVRHLVEAYGCRRKTDIECSWPFVYVAEIAQDAGSLISGYRNDVYYGLTRRAAQWGCLTSLDAMNEYRREGFSEAHTGQMIAIRKLLHCPVEFPYAHPDIQALFVDRSWSELNRPKQKYPMRLLYPDRLARSSVRPHQNLQSGDSGIAVHFEKLIDTPLNPGGKYKSVVGIYNDLARGVDGG